MSFVTNPVQQMTIDDITFHLTARERKALDQSWAKSFSEEIFPRIDEEQPLSDKSLTRFRNRCYDYYTKIGTDLIHNCIASLACEIAKVMKITG